MTRIFTEGFEAGDLLFFTSTSQCSNTTANSRSGARCLLMTTLGNAKKSFTALSEAYFRVPIHTTGSGKFFEWDSSTTELGSIRINSISRKIEIYTSTGTLVATGSREILVNTWYLIEVYVKINDAGTITVKVDGTQDCTFSGDTKPGAATTMDNVVYEASGFSFDDLAMNSTAGGADNSWPGDGRVIALTPDANGDLSQLVGSDGNSVDNYLLVDEIPPDGDTTYVEGSIVDEKDLYNLTPSGLTNETINRVWSEARSKDTVGAGGLIALTVKTNGTEYDSADLTLGTSYARLVSAEYLVNPQTGAAWTTLELDALQVGPKTRS